MRSSNFTNARKLLEQNRVDALKWVIESLSKELNFNDIKLTVEARESKIDLEPKTRRGKAKALRTEILQQ